MKRTVVGILLVLMTLASATVWAEGSKETAAPTAGGKVNLRFAVWDLATTQYLKPTVDAYIAKNPNVTIEYIDIAANDYTDKMSVMLSGGDTVDLISVKDIPQYAGMLTRGQTIALNDYIARDKWDLKQYSGVTDELMTEGKIYALPFRSDIWILYYNKTLFDKAGVPYPTNDMTWTDYERIAKQVTSGSGAGKVYGGHHHTWRSTTQLATVQDGKNTVIAKDYSFMKPTYERMIRMQRDGTIMDWASQRAGNLHYRPLFYNEQIAMLPMGTWFIGTIISAKNKGETKVNWGIVKYPHPEGVPAGTTAGTITSLAINSRSTNKDQAWDFLKFFCGPEGAKILAQSTLPAVRNADILAEFAKVPGFPDGGAAALETKTVRLELPYHPKASAIEQILNEQHELILTESVPIDKGLADMGERVAKLLAQ